MTKLKVEVTYNRTKVPQKVTKVYRVAPFGIPSGIPDSILTQEGQLIISLDADSPAALDPPGSGAGHNLTYNPAVSGKVEWQAGGDAELLQLTY